MTGWRQQDWTLRRIAEELNRLSIRSPRGRQWYASSVRNQIRTAAGTFTLTVIKS
jgi:proline dehydrogenase